ncbi:hypothetical protein KZO85_12635 [Chromohalobacter canadensis]|uniref:hypothetical protein n=1 Tax=Chromohalobacter canadensis TaxID=141389 RepID=UPI0021BFF9C3|nr:hypothetical protein [Chromohalobacter canadensis]MCT8469432.1 hypothetical protein [Chromohalobacter canadensis]MCT8472056.1 hypothetical protein [Chromohalobacter canadensis]MCT8499831.1 hypothetical protein [Chromohalobacter canadensis]
MTSNPKNAEMQQFVENYDLLVAHGVGPSLIRTRVFNELSFPKVKITDDHKSSSIAHARLMRHDELSSVNDSLSRKIESYILNHHKVVQVFDMNTPRLQKIETSISKEIGSQGNVGMVSYYPKLPDDVNVIPDFLHPVEIVAIKQGVKAILVASRRDYYKTFHLNKSDIKDGVLQDVKDVQNVSAKGMVSEIALDVVVLDYNRERLELRLSKAKGISGKFREKFQAKLAAFARQHLSGKLGYSYDFLPKVRPLYFRESDNGLVSRLDFLTDEGIERTEKSRGDKKDIRKAEYHRHGANSIGYEFQGFGIRKVWSFERQGGKYKLSLDILGNANLLRRGNQPIDHIFLLDCFSDSDYNFLLNQVIPS